MDKIIAGDNPVILMLLMFIAGLLTKRFVPWWVHEDVLKKLKEYEEAAPQLITDMRRLISIIEEGEMEEETVIMSDKPLVVNPKVKSATSTLSYEERLQRIKDRMNNEQAE